MLLTRLQRLAAERDMPYQRLLKQFVEERLAEEEAARGQTAVLSMDELRLRAVALAHEARELERTALRLVSG
jgi:hypothetical protein